MGKEKSPRRVADNEALAVGTQIRGSAQKLNLVAALIRGRKVEEALNDKKTGDSVSVTLEPEDAFGDYDAKLVRMESVSDLPPDVTVGGYLVAEQDGSEVVWRITDIADGKAVLDATPRASTVVR